jgi:2-polyprenyl-3-methyl-5-hydroxy-6-metoxy-1,4-benzoquinol methylase
MLGADHIFNCSLIEARLGPADFDAITFWSALEHMNHPRSNLLQARRLLKPGGTIIVQVPNAASHQARMFKGSWFALDVPRHRYHFNLDVLDGLLLKSGFQIYLKTYFSKAHNAHAFRQSLKARLRATSSRPGFAAFCLAIPFIRSIDFVMTTLGSGATLTVAAHAI